MSCIGTAGHVDHGKSTLVNALTGIDPDRLDARGMTIDRVFTLAGFGTIVTGTLLDGSLKIEQEIEVLPQGLRARVRGIQMHRRQVELVRPGGRIALNLPNIAKRELARGNVLGLPGQMRATRLCDVRLTLPPEAEKPLAHNALVDFYCGSQEIPARVRLLDIDELQPGKQGWAQLRLERPAVVTRRERFILRIPSPSATIGGGEIVEAQPRYHCRSQPDLLENLERLTRNTPEEVVLAVLDRKRVAGKLAGGPTCYETSEIASQCNLANDVTGQVLETLLSEGSARTVGGYWFAQHTWEALETEARELVRDYHRNHPLRYGVSKEEWRSRLHITSKLASELLRILQTEGQLEATVPGKLPGKSEEEAARASAAA